VKRLVALHGGTVSAFSEGHGKGCVVSVELPAALPRADLDHDTPASREAPARQISRSGKLRVMVVDDNADAAEMLSAWLKRSGYDAPIAHDGDEALATAARVAPHVVLLDIGLPGRDGFEVARQLRESTVGRPAPVLVAVTGFGQGVDRTRSSQEGFHAHLVKPIDLDRLTTILETVQTTQDEK
jgi:CheY-like chemotaxis protein